METHKRADGTGIGIGASLHCQRQLWDLDNVVLDVDAPDGVTNQNQVVALDFNYPFTIRINPAEGGSPLIFIRRVTHK